MAFRSNALLGIVFVALLLLPTLGSAQGVENEIRQTREQIEKARTANLQLIAPRAFEKAEALVTEAEERFAKGGKIEGIRERLMESKDHLATARGFEEVGNVLLRTTIAARDAANKVKAPQLVAELWANAEKVAVDAGRKVESGDNNGARDQARKAESMYRDAEFEAIRTDVLADVWKLRDRAAEEKASERANLTFTDANRRLEEAEKSIQADRYARDKANALASAATSAYQHTLSVCAQVASIEKDRKAGPEQLVRGYEREMERIATAMGVEASFSEGYTAAADELVEASRRSVKDREKLLAKVTDLEGQVGGLKSDLSLAQTDMNVLSGRDQMLKEREKYEKKLKEVQRVFGPDEADVFLAGDRLTMRLHGLSFPVNSSEIRPANFAVLSKVRRVLDTFPGAPISVEGHTDSRGNDSKNFTLSQARADAVRDYLLANTNLSPDRVVADGHGETRPIANNETEEGRAKNRRIDLTIDLGSRNI